MASGTSWRARRHRATYWTCVVLAVVALVGGSVVAYLSYADTGGPAGAVRGYFAALKRADAPAAVAFGDIPAGSRALLTRAVLREQQHVAPMSDVRVIATSRAGNSAAVTVTYRLQFRTGTQQVSDQVQLQNRHGTWHLDAVAVATRLVLSQADDRGRILDTPVPSDQVLLFPGAVPVAFDTPYLQLSAATSVVQMDGNAETKLVVEPSAQGRAAALTALKTLFSTCLAGTPTADPLCPLATARGVPGTLRGVTVGQFAPDATVAVSDAPQGRIDVAGHVQVRGTYQELDFNDLAVRRSGTVSVLVSASAYATPPLRFTWQVRA
jgi:hypothetical protein